jgi:hypothetical protein
MATELNKQRTCTECGSTDFAAGVCVSLTGAGGSVGLTYRAGTVFRVTEPLYADVCRQCGTVARFSVREKDKPWLSD